jgi:hypothetical protein
LAPTARAVKRPWGGGAERSPETAQPVKTGWLAAILVTARSTVAEPGSFISVPERRRRFPSQLGDERLHFKLNVGRQSPQSFPMEHFRFLLRLQLHVSLRQVAF